jgi:hypothetical protein
VFGLLDLARILVLPPTDPVEISQPGASISGRSSWLIWKRTAELSDEGSLANG